MSDNKQPWRAEEVETQDLMPGDLFSMGSILYWGNTAEGVVGEKVYIRTNEPCPPYEAGKFVTRIVIVKKEVMGGKIG